MAGTPKSGKPAKKSTSKKAAPARKPAHRAQPAPDGPVIPTEPEGTTDLNPGASPDSVGEPTPSEPPNTIGDPTPTEQELSTE